MTDFVISGSRQSLCRVSRTQSRRSCWALLLAFFCLPSLLAQDGICAPDLKPPTGDSSYGYQLRGDRCEGIYAREVAGTTLLVASFTRGFEDFNTPIPQSLHVAWTPLGSNPVRVRAYSLRSQLYYQMDTVRPSGLGSYLWPTNVLSGLGLRKSELGVVARTSMSVGGSEHEIYLPVRIGISNSPAAGKYDLVLLSDQELSEVFVTLAQLGPDGQQLRTLRQNVPLAYGFYPAQRGIHLGLPEVTDKGFYLAAVGATLRSGGSYTLRFWFYNDGK